ncbi:MAG TPA: transcription antitermination factor NusB [Chlamydiales bacterium]|nr:transcription antitermination factor NusB [Chlamydiales bacterium]
MGLPKQKRREIIFQILFSNHFAISEEKELVSLMMKQLKVTKASVKEALEYTKKILEHLEEIDQIIRKEAQNYAFDRIAGVELTASRLAIYEMLYDSTIPHKVSISEAIRLSRKFGTKESGSFVNGVLDSVYKTHFADSSDGNI